MIFCKKRKTNPRYVGPYTIKKKVGDVSCELYVQAKLAVDHPLFHISLLKDRVGDPASIIPLGCVGDPTSIIPLESVVVKDSHTFE